MTSITLNGAMGIIIDLPPLTESTTDVESEQNVDVDDINDFDSLSERFKCVN
jgi:hypothetical protein